MTIELVAGWRPGVIGEVAAAHGRYYARDWGFGAFFEAKVASEISAFVGRYHAEQDLLMTAWRAETFLGSIVIDGSDPNLDAKQAHLRWFIMTDAARGAGVGRRLLANAFDFLRGGAFASCYLTTFAGLDAARRLYENHGFRLTDEGAAESWGVEVVEQRFEWVR